MMKTHEISIVIKKKTNLKGKEEEEVKNTQKSTKLCWCFP